MFPLTSIHHGRSFVQDKKGNLWNSGPWKGPHPAFGGTAYRLNEGGHPRFFLTLFLLHKRPNIFIVLT